MKRFPNAPQILVQDADGSVAYQPLGHQIQDSEFVLPTWQQIGEYIDFRSSGQALMAAAQSSLNSRVFQPA